MFAARESAQETLGFSPFGPLQMLKESWLAVDDEPVSGVRNDFQNSSVVGR